MNYTIGEFAAMLGVTKDTLRLYEKHGIIKPKKDNSNNYRYFTDLDARNLLMSRWYRSMEIPLQEVAILTKKSSLDDIGRNLMETQLQLEEEIKKRTMLLEKVIEINQNFKKIQLDQNICKVRKVSGIYRLNQTNGNNLLQNASLKSTVNIWMDLLPYTFYSFKIDKDQILLEQDDYNCSWGLAIYEDELIKLKLDINDNMEYISPGTYISSIIFVSEKEYILKDSLQFMIDYIENNQFIIKGDIIGKIIFTEKVNGQNNSYLEVNIPI